MSLFKYSIKLILLTPLFLALLSCSDSVKNNAETLTVSAGDKLHKIIEKDWQRYLEAYPEMASYLGDKRYNNRWSNLTESAILAVHQQDKSILKELSTIAYSELNDSDKINYDLFKWQIQSNIDKFQFSPYLMPINQLEGVQTIYQYADYFPMNNLQDYQDWLKRLESLPILITQVTDLMKMGIAQGVVPPQITISRVPNQVKQHLVENPKDSLFFSKFISYPDSISDSDQLLLTEQAINIVENKITPAYKALYEFINNDYLPACKEAVGVLNLPKGKAYYQHLIHYYTTTNLTADEIHAIGLKEVARNRAEMEEIIQEVNFDGDFNAFLHFLRTDPQFYYDTPEALLEGYRAISKRLDPELPKLFGKLPRMPYGVIPIPDSIAPDTTTAYYYSPSADGTRPGYYYVNLYQPETRPKYEMEVLSVHEAVPGHHLQIALQMELGDLPNFRRYLDFTVFTEGWGLYSERLGYDMGLYQDPYSRFGQLTYDMWRAVRLVVDTGMHAKGWTRQQAIDYFTDNAAKSKEDITNEIDRYISWPGQALAYKIGQLKILELREKAEQSLGDKFDIRGFHDVVLGSGSIPLNVLEININQWINAQK